MNDNPEFDAAAPDIFADGGEMGARMRAFDWSTSPLGPPAGWPQSLRTLASLAATSREPMFVAWGPELAMVYNDAYAPLLGEKHPAAVGRPFTEVWSDIWEQFSPIVARVMAGESVWFQDLHIPMQRHGYAEDTWFSFSYTPVRDETGQVAGFFCACTETTAKVRGEAALRASEEQNRAIIEGAVDHAIFSTDPQGVITSWPPGAQAAFGLSADEAIGRPTDIVFTPEDRALGVPHAELAAAAAEGCAPDERWHVRRDGSRVFMNGSARPLHGTDGRITGFLKIAHDETERRQVFEALAQSEARARALAEEQTRLAAIMRQTPDFVGVADAEGQPIFVNEAGRRMVGLPDLDAVHRTGFADYHEPEEGRRLVEEIIPIVVRDGLWEGELTFRRFDDGRSVPVFGRLFAVRDELGELSGTAAILTDITERKQAETTLRETTRRLDAVLNNATVSVFLMDERQQCVYMNAAAETLTGYSLAETQGRALHEVVHHTRPDGRPYPLSECPIDQALPKDNQMQGEEIFVHKDGSFYPVAFTASPVRDESGAPIGTVIEVRNIAAEKAATEALQSSEARFRTLVDAVPAFVWFATSAGDLNFYNARWYAFTGLTPEQSMGSRWVDVLHPDDVASTAAAWEEARARGMSYVVECRYRRIDGAYRWFVARAEPLRDEAGEITGWFGTSTDIHDRKEAEARLSAIMDAVPVGILMAEAPSGRLVRTNRYMETLLRRPVRQAEGAPDYAAREAYLPDGRRLEPGEWPIQRVLATGRPAETEARFKRGDDTFGWLRIQAAPVRDAAGDTVGAVAGVTDVDEIVQARDILARSRQELEQRAEQLAAERDRMWRVTRELMLVAKFDGEIEAVNPAWTPTLGWAPAELVGTSFMDLIHPDDLESTVREAASLGEGRPTPRFENRYRGKDGVYRWLSWTAVPEAERIFAVARDVTAEKAAEADLARMEDQLRQAQKMEAVGQLTGGVAHDFNNLLQIVVGNLELLNRSLPEDATRQRRSVDNAMSGARRAVTLTQRLLAFSRRQPLEPKPVSANKLVAGMSELLSRSLGETVQLETVLAGGLWQVEVDPNQLENAILNLAVNARDAMPDGGKLTIETANTRLDESYVQQNVEVTPGQYVVICVSDTGVGMEKALTQRAFEPFFTTKEVGKGTGLGLSQVYGFVKQSGGHVKIYSEQGGEESRGTTVKIYLPRYHGEGAEEEEAAEAAAPGGDDGETVLVVEDDPDVRAYTVEVLGELGYRVLEAADAHAALRLLRDGAVHCDLLFTDVVLPGGLNGEQLAAAAHEARPGLKVLFTTGYARNAIVHQGRLDPGVRLITKPFTYADLAARVREVLDEELVAARSPS